MSIPKYQTQRCALVIYRGSTGELPKEMIDAIRSGGSLIGLTVGSAEIMAIGRRWELHASQSNCSQFFKTGEIGSVWLVVIYGDVSNDPEENGIYATMEQISILRDEYIRLVSTDQHPLLRR